MAYNEALALRIAELLTADEVVFLEKKMFGGVAFMIADKMCVGVSKDQMMLRVLDEVYEKSLHLKYAQPMKFTTKVMKGFLFIDPEGTKTNTQLKKWISLGLDFGKYGIVKSKVKKK